ncbi:MAG: hypothetical protein AAFR75_09080 [Pseudomonadota bacterium]
MQNPSVLQDQATPLHGASTCSSSIGIARAVFKFPGHPLKRHIATALWVTLIVAIHSLALATRDASAAELIMFEEDGCEWCEKWNEEIGIVYDKTSEGRKAPLRRIDIHDTRPTDLRKITRINFTPTFVVVENGQEYGRILGHPGEDFFWPMLRKILAKLPVERKPEQENQPSYAQPQPIRFEPEGAPKNQKILEDEPNAGQANKTERTTQQDTTN